MRTLLLLSAMFLWLAVPLGAETVRLPLGDRLDLDHAGNALRRALNGYEMVQRSGTDSEWALLNLAVGENHRLGGNLFVVLLETSGDAHRFLVVNRSGAHEVLAAPGRPVKAGTAEILLLSPADNPNGSAQLLLRSSERVPLLVDGRREDSPTRIVGEERPPRLVVTSSDPVALRFAEEFIAELRRGATPETAAAKAREVHDAPGLRSLETSRAAMVPVPDRIDRYTDLRNISLPHDRGAPYAAMVTLRLVRGATESIGQLSSAMQYDSRGNRPDNPAIGAESGPEGGRITYGQPGDRFQATLRVLEREGRVQTESETFVRVPLGGTSNFDMWSQGRQVSSTISAQLRGGDAAELRLYNHSGDWPAFGRLNTTARVRDGQTVLLARNTYQRSESYSSGVPILHDIPYLGPVFGSSGQARATEDYALFATVRFEE